MMPAPLGMTTIGARPHVEPVLRTRHPRSVEMSESSHQTVQLSPGRHESPARGACVLELASMLAGERFSDHPQAVCPVLAGFLRSYNDLLPETNLDELYPYAALVVGTASSASVRRRRAHRLLEWAERPRRSLVFRLAPWAPPRRPVARPARRLAGESRRIEVARLLEELAAIGPRSAVPAT